MIAAVEPTHEFFPGSVTITVYVGNYQYPIPGSANGYADLVDKACDLARMAAIALLAQDGTGSPYPHYRVLRSHAPVYALSPGRIFVTGHAQAGRVLRDPRFRSRDLSTVGSQWPGWQRQPAARSAYQTMLFANSPRHLGLRRPYAQKTKTYNHLLVPEAERALTQMPLGGEVDFMPSFAQLYPTRVVLRLLGLPAADANWWSPRLYTFGRVFEHLGPGDDLGPANLAATELLARARLTHPGADGNFIFVLSAGVDTTANLLATALDRLLDHPGELAALRRSPELTGPYVTEMLRYDPPLQLTTRIASQDTELAGVPVKAGALLMIFAGSANRDETRYPHGDDFDPAREQPAPLSFGAGPHYCPGAALARDETETGLRLFLQRFPGLRRAGAAVRYPGMLLRGFRSLPVDLGF
jgi:cytochrome P450